MSDKEIIKALERMSEEDAEGFSNDVLNLIKRQQAEIERLNKENKILSENADTAFQDGLNEAQDLYAEQIKNVVRTEAIRDFANRLYYKHTEYLINENGEFLPYVRRRDIDTLAKEMVGAIE